MVAEQFGTLEAIYPGRIDLGLGRAPGGDFQTMRALRHGLAQDGDDFPSLIEELRTHLGPERPRAEQFWDNGHLITAQTKQQLQHFHGNDPSCCEDGGHLWDMAAMYPGSEVGRVRTGL